MEWQLSASRFSRRTVLGATAVLAAGPALAEECRLGPAPHEKGARVFMDMDQQELDASYNQLAYEPLLPQAFEAACIEQRGDARQNWCAPARSPMGHLRLRARHLSHEARERADFRFHPWRRVARWRG